MTITITTITKQSWSPMMMVTTSLIMTKWCRRWCTHPHSCPDNTVKTINQCVDILQAYNFYAWVTLEKHKHPNEMLISHVLQWLVVTQLLRSVVKVDVWLVWQNVTDTCSVRWTEVFIYVWQYQIEERCWEIRSMESAYDMTSNAMHVWPRYGKLSKHLLLLINPSQLQ